MTTPERIWADLNGTWYDEATSFRGVPYPGYILATPEAIASSPEVAALIAEARREGWNAAIEAGAYEVAELFEHIAEERGSRDGARQAKRIAAAIRALKETTHD